MKISQPKKPNLLKKLVKKINKAIAKIGDDFSGCLFLIVIGLYAIVFFKKVSENLTD